MDLGSIFGFGALRPFQVHLIPLPAARVWTTASRRKATVLGLDTATAGPWTQVSRLGNPAA